MNVRLTKVHELPTWMELMFCWCWIRSVSLNFSRCFYLDKDACFCCTDKQQLCVYYESIVSKFRPPVFELYSNVRGGG